MRDGQALRAAAHECLAGGLALREPRHRHRLAERRSFLTPSNHSRKGNAGVMNGMLNIQPAEAGLDWRNGIHEGMSPWTLQAARAAARIWRGA